VARFGGAWTIVASHSASKDVRLCGWALVKRSRQAGRGGISLERAAFERIRHREKQSDVAIQAP
jgi:hypothetical protein